jgi:hypothetical protein
MNARPFQKRSAFTTATIVPIHCDGWAHAPQNIRASAPSRGLESALRDDGRSTAHCIECLGESMRVNAAAVDAHNRKAVRLKMVEIALLVQSYVLDLFGSPGRTARGQCHQ